MELSKAKDMAERSVWTGIEAALAIAVVDLGDISIWWAAPLALVLTSAKTWVKGQMERGNE